MSERGAFQGGDEEFGLRLGCRWLIAGAVHRSGNELHVSARLIDVPTGCEIEEVREEGSREELFVLQQKLAEGISKLLDETLEAPAPKGTRSVEAYECCTRGFRQVLRGQKIHLEQAQELFERALELDPSYALACAGLAASHALRFPYTTEIRHVEVAEEYAHRAIELNPGLYHGHVWLGYCYYLRNDFFQGVRAFQKAIDCDPTQHNAWYFIYGGYGASFRREEAVRFVEQVTEQKFSGDPHRWLREKTVMAEQRAVLLKPDMGMAWIWLGVAHFELGRPAEAIWCLEKAAVLERQNKPFSAGGVCCLGEALRRSGELDQAREAARESLDLLEKGDPIYRDTTRGLSLCVLGRTVLQQGNLHAAEAAFTQAAQLLRGRAKARAGGHVLVRALAGLSQATGEAEFFEEGLDVFFNKKGNLAPLYFCSHDITLLELARAARKLGRARQAGELLEAALDYGSVEALEELGRDRAGRVASP